MIRAVKILGLLLVAFVLLAALAATALIFWVDPNIFKDDVEKLARDQGLQLDLEGELSWQFYPEIQIALGRASLSTLNTPDQPLLHVEEAGLSVALMPLFSGLLQIEGISLQGANIHLIVDEQGVANWDFAATTTPEDKARTDSGTGTGTGKGKGPVTQSESAPPAGEQKSSPFTGIERLRLGNSHIRFEDRQTGLDIAVENLGMSGDNITLDGQPFPIELSAKINYRDATQTLNANLAIDGAVAISSSMDAFALKDTTAVMSLTLANAGAKLELASTVGVNANLKTGDKLVWSIPALTLSDTSIRYAGDGDQSANISSLSFQGAVTPGETLNPVELKTSLSYSSLGFSLPADTQLQLNGQVGINTGLDRLTLKGTSLSIGIESQRVVLNTDTTLTLGPELSYVSQVEIATFNLRKFAPLLGLALPEMASAEALGKISLKAALQGDADKILASSVTLGLDSSTLNAKATLPFDAKANKTVAIGIDRINIDHYLPPVNEQTAATETPSSAADEALPIPSELLNTLNVDAELKIDALTARNIPLSSVQLTASVHNGLSRISPLKGQVYDSPFNLDASLDTRRVPSSIKIKGDSTALPLGKLLRELEVSEVFSGISNLKLDLQSQGDSQTRIIQNLSGNIDLSAQQMRLNNVNIERAFCQLVTRLQEEPFDPTAWPAYSDLNDTVTRISFNNGVAKIETLKSGVTKIVLGGKGKIDLREESFDVVLNSHLSQADQDTVSCRIKNEKLLDRDIPIRCKAEFGKINLTTCLPDFRVMEDIAKEKAKSKFEEKAQEAIDKKLGGEKGEAAKQLFKQFLNK